MERHASASRRVVPLGRADRPAPARGLTSSPARAASPHVATTSQLAGRSGAASAGLKAPPRFTAAPHLAAVSPRIAGPAARLSAAAPPIAPPRDGVVSWPRGPRALDPSGIAIQWPPAGFVLRLAVAMAAALLALDVVSASTHAPMGVPTGLLARAVAASAPLAVGIVVGLAVLRPRTALPIVLLLVPYWDAAQVSYVLATPIGAVQVILQTIFVVALAAGAAFELDRLPRPAIPRSLPTRLGLIAAVSLLSLAILSTIASPDRLTSFAVLLHGILEPASMALFVLFFARTRRQLVALLALAGFSVAVGGALNMVQTLPAARTVSTLQTERLLFARLTYFNVGLFGELLAMSIPLLVGLLMMRGPLARRRLARVALMGALLVAMGSLYLTFSKSAWLATFAALLALLVLLAGSWRRRIAVVLVAMAISAAVVPWPYAVLEPVAPPVAGAYRSAMVNVVGSSRFDSWNPATLSGRGSLVERFYATEAAVRMALDHPLFGIGLDQFKFQYVASYRPHAAQLALDSAHSFWPEIAAELGLPALAMTVMLFLAAFWAAWLAYRRSIDDRMRHLAATVLAALVAWLVVASLYAGDMYRPWRNMASDFLLMAVLVAAAFALPRLAAPTRERMRSVVVHY